MNIKNSKQNQYGRNFDTIRDIWRLVTDGNTVCVVLENELTARGVFGSYYKTLELFINKGLIYFKFLESNNAEEELIDKDLKNHTVFLGG